MPARHASRRACLALALCAAASSCGGGARSTHHAGRAAADAHVLAEADVRGVLETVAAARQLPATHPIRVNRIDRKSFIALLREDTGDPADEPGLSASAAFLLGFNLVPPPERRKGMAGAAEVLEEEVAGFYDLRKDAIFVPLVALASEKDAMMQKAVLAHEAEHALQHQHFPPRREHCERDGCLAELALWEGDAMVAMGSYLGTEQGEPIGRTLRRITDVTRDVSLERLTKERGRRAIDRTAPVLRREIEFPYVEGMLFVDDLYRAGGFPLVDAAFKTPPTSTMHILHPDKYLAGVEPRSFSDVTAPRGERRLASGVMGEMLTGTLLEQCLDHPRAERVADGWAGDRYAVFVGPDRSLSLGWVSAWETPGDAEDFEHAIADAGLCFSPNRLGEATDYTIGADVHVARQERLVVMLRNVEASRARALEKALFASAGKEVEPKPRSMATIPRRKALPPPRPGRLEGYTYHNDWLGLVGQIPSGMAASVDHDGMDLVISRSDVIVHGGLAVSTRVANREQNERTLRDVYDGFKGALAKEGIDIPILVRRNGPIRTPLGDGFERTWGAGDTSLELRMVILPVCAGTGSVVFVQIYADPYARTVLDGWMASFHFTAGRNLEACAYLDPK